MNAPTRRTGRSAQLLGRLLGPLLGLLLCPALVGSVRADDLGRLFTSTAERARIDTLRSGKQLQQDDATSIPSGDRVVVNGTLRGSDGKRLVWLNGTPVKPGSSRNMTLLRDGRVQLTWRDGAKILKPGQGIDQTSGEIFENHTPVPVPAPTPVVKETVAETKPKVAAAATAPTSTPEAAAATAAETKPAVAVESKAK
ncbi:MAG: hypothetical protein HZB57_10030 [Gammaproteobacteria bacterium]|nr:hypothetical protein [Gammaproteobacteria bacterium]